MNDEKNLAWPVYLLLLVIDIFQILYGIGGTALLDPDEPVLRRDGEGDDPLR